MSTLTVPAPDMTVSAAARRAGLAAAVRWEVRKLRHQIRARAVLAGAVVAPVAVAFIIHGQGRPPKDTLLGRYATGNGFALALLLLGFAAQWALPLLTSMVAGDIFAAEDQHGTWKTILTRSATRSTVFWAKAITAAGFAVLALLVLGASTIASSVLVGGHGALTGLSGQVIAPHRALLLVSESWATTIAPTLGFTALALVLSVASRIPAVGIAAPAVLGMVMQLVGALGGIEALRPFLLSTPYESWHGLLAAPAFTGPLLSGLLTSFGWCGACLAIAFVLFRRRDITGG